jgi:amphi-Trp domain-containing protein
MTKKKQRRTARDMERAVSRKEFVVKLRRLAEAIETGQPFVIQVAGERIRIPGDAKVSIEHEREGSTEELEFQLKWKRGAKQ